MKNWWGIAFGVVVGLLGAGVLFLLTRQPRGEIVHLLPPPTPQPCVVHVAGAVLHPGVYSLPHGTRVGEALKAAGGAVGEADLELLNLAAPVADGERIWVPSQAGDSPAVATPSLSEENGTGGTATAVGLVDINAASQAELESLPRIGPVLAQAILQHRQENGPFEDISEIQEVSGIGPGIFEQIKDLISTGN